MVQPLKLVAFVLVMIAYLFVPISAIFNQEKILSSGETYKFLPAPVDPYDAFRGKFIWLNIPPPVFDLEEELRLKRGQKVYVHLERDTAGYTEYTGFTTNRPEGNNYLQTNISRIIEDRVWLKTPESLTKFYLNEKLAPLAERKYRELRLERRDTSRVEIDVKVYKGKALIDNLYFDQEPILDFLRKQ